MGKLKWVPSEYRTDTLEAEADGLIWVASVLGPSGDGLWSVFCFSSSTSDRKVDIRNQDLTTENWQAWSERVHSALTGEI